MIEHPKYLDDGKWDSARASRASREPGPSVGFVSAPGTTFDGVKQWREPKPLPDGLLPVPAFEPDYLPTAIRAWATDIAERMQCPLDFVGAPALVALGAGIGRRVCVRPQQATDWVWSRALRWLTERALRQP